MSENIHLPWGFGRVYADTLDLLEDEERRCLELSVMQCSILRQMVFPWARAASRLVEDHGDYQTIVDQPVAYQEALDELEILLSGAYDGPETGCPVGEVYVDRGDLPGYDVAKANLTCDDAWHELNLVNVVGDALATRVRLRSYITGNMVSGRWGYREAGNTADVNTSQGTLRVTTSPAEPDSVVVMSGDQRIEYRMSPSFDVVAIVVRGYWVPAV